MNVTYVEQSLKAKPWVKAFVIIDPLTNGIVYAASSDAGYTTKHAECLMDPSNKLVSRDGKWSTGAFWNDNAQDLDIAFARNVGGYTVVVETGTCDVDFATKKRGAKSLANAAKHALKLAGMYRGLYESC